MDKQFAQGSMSEADKLADILNRNSDWVWEVDVQGRYVWVSNVVNNLLG